MEGILKLYLLGILVSTTGVVDQNETKILKAQLEPTAVIGRAPPLNNYKTCLLSAKKELVNCQTDLNLSIKAHINTAHTIFKKQRNCELKKELNHTICKSLFFK